MATIPHDGEGQQRPGTVCVDLDGTLIRTDTLVEGLLQLLHDPGSWVHLPGWLLRGRAAFKQQVMARAPVDPTLLPYEHTLISYLEAQRACGRHLVLTSAADRDVAERVSAHLKMFDDVVASDGSLNLKGRTKGDVLAARFGAGNFTYVGNSWPDLHVWRRAGSAVLVNGSKRLADEVAKITTLERRIDDRPSRGLSFVKALRPHQWLKNVLVFLPIFTANALRDTQAWFDAAMMFMAFCATASASYIVNDLTDLSADRRHPRKRRRPFASADLPIIVGPIAAPLLLIVAVGLGLTIGTAHILLFYMACSLVYSFKLKELPLVDVFTLALLYSLRVFGGGEASGYRLSPWLLAFSIFLFLGLATIKRVAELMDVKRHEGRTTLRRGYHTDDLPVLQSMGVGASFVSTTVLALYVQSDSVAARYTHPELLWLIVPLVLFWQCRLWLSTARGYMHDDPIVYAARDRVSWLTAAAVSVVFILARGINSRAG
jgi:4-hydroxybenzoate polyprenyltransferase